MSEVAGENISQLDYEKCMYSRVVRRCDFKPV